MNKQDILLLYQYNAWSTAKILEAASALTHGQFIASAPVPHGSLRGTLVHALFAEWIWRKRWEGNPPAIKWKPEDFPSFDALRARWAEEEPRLMDFLSSVTDERLNDNLKYVSTEGDPHERLLWETMAH